MKNMPVQDHEFHTRGLDPVISQDCRILILGSFPSDLSLQKSEYYANPRNDFWKIIEEILGIPLSLSYPERISRLNNKRVGLWDVVRSCSRSGSADSTIRNTCLNPICQLLEKYSDIRCLACNGRKAETGLSAVFRANIALSRHVDIIYLPSTSPAHAVRFQEKCEAWTVLCSYLTDHS